MTAVCRAPSRRQAIGLLILWCSRNSECAQYRVRLAAGRDNAARKSVSDIINRMGSYHAGMAKPILHGASE
jgi:hypothetical protein